MSRSFLFASLLLFAVPARTQSADNDNELEITHLTGEFYIYTTYREMGGDLVPANGLYALTGEGAILIDTPWDTTQFQPLLDSISLKHGSKVAMCLSTHSHADRTAGLEYYASRGIKTYSTAMTLGICRETGEKQAAYTFTHDTTFTVGEHSFETFYPGAGHTEDNIVVWFGDARILYGGCFIKSTESPDLGYIGESDLPEWSRSMRRTMKKYPHPAWVIPGHFGWKSKSSPKHTLRLLKAHRKSR